jgi:hypothetical protein
MALMRACALLLVLLLTGWASGLAAATAQASGPQARADRDVFPLALRCSRQLRDQVALPPLLRGKQCPRGEKLMPTPRRPAPGPGRWQPTRLLLYTLMSLRC